jgi:hypothetical protein
VALRGAGEQVRQHRLGLAVGAALLAIHGDGPGVWKDRLIQLAAISKSPIQKERPALLSQRRPASKEYGSYRLPLIPMVK